MSKLLKNSKDCNEIITTFGFWASFWYELIILANVCLVSHTNVKMCNGLVYRDCIQGPLVPVGPRPRSPGTSKKWDFYQCLPPSYGKPGNVRCTDYHGRCIMPLTRCTMRNVRCTAPSGATQLRNFNPGCVAPAPFLYSPGAQKRSRTRTNAPGHM